VEPFRARMNCTVCWLTNRRLGDPVAREWWTNGRKNNMHIQLPTAPSHYVLQNVQNMLPADRSALSCDVWIHQSNTCTVAASRQVDTTGCLCAAVQVNQPSCTGPRQAAAVHGPCSAHHLGPAQLAPLAGQAGSAAAGQHHQQQWCTLLLQGLQQQSEKRRLCV
jgi:hypothetical protein